MSWYCVIGIHLPSRWPLGRRADARNWRLPISKGSAIVAESSTMNLSRPLTHAAAAFSIFCSCALSNAPAAAAVPFVRATLGRRFRSLLSTWKLQPNRWADSLRDLPASWTLPASRCGASRSILRMRRAERLRNNCSMAATSSRSQLFVEPQPLAAPDVFDLTRPIRMSRCRGALHTPPPPMLLCWFERQASRRVMEDLID